MVNRWMVAMACGMVALRALVTALEGHATLLGVFFAAAAACWVYIGIKVIRDGVE